MTSPSSNHAADPCPWCGLRDNLSVSRTVIAERGPGARALIEKGCSLDLYPRAFTPGQCAQTLLGRTRIILDQVKRGAALYRSSYPGSLARYLRDWRSTPQKRLCG